VALPEIITSIPGPRSRALASELRRYESRNVTHVADDWPIFWERADEANVWDADENRYLDLTSAFGVSGLGHTNAEVQAAIATQSTRLIHAMGDVHPTERKVELCRLLSDLTFERWGSGPGKVILGNSGFEAVEAALKTSILYSGKPGVLAFTGSYHGLGFGALSVTQLPYFRDPFRASLKEFASFVPFPHCYRCPYDEKLGFRCEGRDFPNCSTTCLERLHDEIETVIGQREIGCILVEPIQGRGGCVVPPRDFLPMLRTICDTHKILLVLDEIYTGFNRTGALFACDHFEVIPDLICLGKALTGGFPLSACVGRADLMDAWPDSAGEALHTSTFLGNPLGCAMALASLKQHIRPDLSAEVKRRGQRFREALRSIDSPSIGNVRGLGLMIGVELVDAKNQPATELAIRVMKTALQNGIILLADSPTSNVLSFSPPFAITDEEMDFVVNWLRQALA
jgi:4-aminobutyrate aminotransferase-like enzyme